MIIFLLLVIIVLVLLLYAGVPAVVIGHWFGWGLSKIGTVMTIIGDMIYNACTK